MDASIWVICNKTMVGMVSKTRTEHVDFFSYSVPP